MFSLMGCVTEDYFLPWLAQLLLVFCNGKYNQFRSLLEKRIKAPVKNWINQYPTRKTHSCAVFFSGWIQLTTNAPDHLLRPHQQPLRPHGIHTI